MKTKTFKRLLAAIAGSLAIASGLKAQNQPAPLNQTNSISLITNGGGAPATGGNLWGYAFGDYAYVQHGDSAGRGTAMQYKGLGSHASPTSNENAFEIRRAYLGYNYNINQKFAAYALLSYEGDYDANGNRTVFLKCAYFKWKNIFKNSDLKIGQQITNSFASAYNSEAIMGYRSIEKTIIDMHKIDGATDMGAMLEGKIWQNKPADSTVAPTFIGYSAMIGNNSGNIPIPVFSGAATPQNPIIDKDKKFRFNVYVNTLNNALTIGAYADYINYGSVPYAGSHTVFQSAVQTTKAYAAYNSKWFGIGGEWFMQSMTNGETKVYKAGTGTNDTTAAIQSGYSIFAHGTIIQNALNVFARYDSYTPDTKYSYSSNETFTSRMTNISNSGNGNSFKETFITAGLDWTPTSDKKVHFMPNIWYYQINNGFGADALKNDNYMVYRITFLYSFK